MTDPAPIQSQPAVRLIDHGSRRAEANALLEAVAEEVRQRLPDRIVQIAHMEIAEPSIEQGVAACVEAGATAIVAHPYFLGPGNHTRDDIPKLVAAAAARHADLEITISDPLGLHSKLIDVVLERISDAAQT
jgi:sirohydrochlorin ferrochelatase